METMNLSRYETMVLESVVYGWSRTDIAREFDLSEAEVAEMVDDLVRHIAQICR